jgi:hypothetical protein
MRELLGWRQFHNRRKVAGCLGLTPTPYASGTSEVELGISKAGHRRCRWLMVELAWSWLRFQPSSQLSRWFNQRFAGTGKRLRRIGMRGARTASGDCPVALSRTHNWLQVFSALYLRSKAHLARVASDTSELCRMPSLWRSIWRKANHCKAFPRS